MAEERFIKPTMEQLTEAAIIFSEGKLDRNALATMIGMGSWLVDRLYENGDITKPTIQEGKD